MGRALLINSIIWSKIYHQAWIIENTPTLGKVKKKIMKFICGKTSNETYSTLAKPKYAGGIELIEIEKRIMAFKVSSIIQSKYDAPETDEIKYQMGVNMEKLYGDDRFRPKKEIRDNGREMVYIKLKHLLNQLELEQAEKLKIRDIENKISDIHPAWEYNYIWKKELPMQSGFNYRAIKDILAINRTYCKICNTGEGGLKHLFTKCPKLRPIRAMMEEILKITLDDQNYTLTNDKIIYLTRVFDITEYYLISEYKYIIWLENIRSLIEERPYNIESIEPKINNAMIFYAEHLIV